MSARKISGKSKALRSSGDQQMHGRLTTEPAGFEDGKIKGLAPAPHKSLS
jgi:hypothetical protein